MTAAPFADLPLFAWATPPTPTPAPQPWRGQPRFGWWTHAPCACGRTHAALYLDYPWSMTSLRHARLSEPSAETAAMMAERHARDKAQETAR